LISAIAWAAPVPFVPNVQVIAGTPEEVIEAWDEWWAGRGYEPDQGLEWFGHEWVFMVPA
jgi:hypothetical protein